MNRYGLNYIVNKPQDFSESYIINCLKTKLKDIYIQSWDTKARSSPKYNILSKLKKNRYTMSNYLNLVTNINIRKRMTKLRLGSSKLNGHRYLSKDDSDSCPYCPNTLESTEHFLLLCTHEKALNIRKENFAKINKIIPGFIELSDTVKLYVILNLSTIDSNCNNNELMKQCNSLISNLWDFRFSNIPEPPS